VVRVDISLDGGKTWEVAQLKEGGWGQGQSGNYTRNWTWALWEYEVPDKALEGKEEVEVRRRGCWVTDALGWRRDAPSVCHGH
jgi:hypothetical protein